MKSILVIDDDDSVRRLAVMGLTVKGYDVQQAENGLEGSKAYRAAPTDLVITDLLMPEQEGLATIKELRADFPNIKIIAISGGSRDLQFDFLQIAKIMGAQKVLHKPFTLAELTVAVEQVLASA